MTSKEIDILFATAVAEWREQGRTDEQIYAVDNFISGRGVKLRKDLLALIQQARADMLNEVVHQSTVNLKSARAVAGWAEIRIVELKGETK